MYRPRCYCPRCGARLDDASAGQARHAACAERLRYEPPRYCTACGRRMVVQVWPAGWSARCSRHGEVSG